jgi:hypothetical protein
MAATTKLDVLPHVVNIEYFKDKSLTGDLKNKDIIITLLDTFTVLICVKLMMMKLI